MAEPSGASKRRDFFISDGLKRKVPNIAFYTSPKERPSSSIFERDL
jgi:hypothetical protein